jgi:hypothetical protein
MKISVRLGPAEIVSKTFDKSSVIVGRSLLKCDFTIPVETLSRQHCQIDYENGSFFITDLGSSNGVFIDGTQIPSHQRVLYTTALPLTLGTLECQLNTHETTKIAYKILPKLEKKPIQNRVVKKAETPKAKMILPAIIIGTFVLGFFYLFFPFDEDVVPVKITPLKEVVKKAANLAVPKDMTVTNYMRLKARKSCEGSAEEIFRGMGLKAEDGEGAILESGRLVIFIKPLTHLQEDHYIYLNKKYKKETMVSLHKFLRAGLLNKQGITDFHIVQLNGMGAIKNILAINHNQALSKEDLLASLDNEIKSLDPADFVETHLKSLNEFSIGSDFGI